MRRMISERGNRNLRGESGLKRKVRVCHLTSLWRIATALFRVRTTKSILRQLKKNINTVKKKSVSASWQTDIDELEMEELVRNVARLKIENKVLRNKVISAAFLQSFSCSALFLSFPSNQCMSLAFRKFCSSGTFILTNEELSIVRHLHELFPWASCWRSKIVTRLSRTNNSKLGYWKL